MPLEDLKVDVRRLTQQEVPEIKSTLVSHAGLIDVNCEKILALRHWREAVPCQEMENSIMSISTRTKGLEDRETERKKDWKSVASVALGIIQTLLTVAIIAKLGL